MKRPSFRGSLDVLGAVALAALLIAAAWGNYWWARRVDRQCPRNLHIAVAAAHPLDAGTILGQEDLVVRVKRLVDMNHAFDDPQRLIGRQLQRALDRDAPIQDTDLVDLSRSRRPRGTFFIVVDAPNAGCIARGQNVLLVPRKEPAAGATSSRTIFRVEAITDVPAKDGEGVSQRRIQLSTDYAQDASAVLAQPADTRYIPVVVGDAPITCPPPAQTPSTEKNKKSATAGRAKPRSKS